MSGGAFTCARCGGRFVAARSDDDAKREAHETFGDDARGPLEVVCDDCYRVLMEWLAGRAAARES